VVVHRVNTDERGASVSSSEFRRLLRLILAADTREGAGAAVNTGSAR
jgi:hypothetical protein